MAFARTPRQQLLLHNTLPTGQSFRWRLTEPDVYTGVIGQRVVQLKQLQDDVQWRVLARGPGALGEADAAVLHDYFNLDADLAAFYSEWSARDDRFRFVAPCLPGARMLRQDPVETLFQFICSSNNHISRIHGMVERLCRTYGSKLLPSSSSSASSLAHQMQKPGAEMPQTPARQQQQGVGSQPPSLNSTGAQLQPAPDMVDMPFAAVLANSADATAAQVEQQQSGAQPPSRLAFYAFPTLQQLSAATEEALRVDGFGYRAKFIVGSVQQLLSKPEGGEAWLLGLRCKPYEEVQAALCSLPGIGPKVAACISLFSLDKHYAIPVDTHVWDLATKYYAPHLAKKTLNKKVHDEIQQVFVSHFGPYAGWAHNTLFISELASHRYLLPTGQTAALSASSDASKRGGKQKNVKKRALGAPEQDPAEEGKVMAAVELPISTDAMLVPADAAAVVVVDGQCTAAGDAAALGSRRSRRTRRRNSRFSSSGSESSDN